MVKRNIVVFVLLLGLLAGVILEQNYIDYSCVKMEQQVRVLETYISNKDLNLAQQQVDYIQNFWKDREIVLSLFADYRDIEQIGKQVQIIKAHLSNKDFELAKVENDLLQHIVKTYHNTVCFDWQNII